MYGTRHGVTSIKEGPTFRRSAWRWYLLVSTGLAVAYWVLPPAQAKLIAWPAIGWCSVAAMLLGIWLHRPDGRRAWYLLACGVAMFIMGDNLFSGSQFIRHELPSFPSLVDVVYLLVYPLLATGLVLLVRKRTPGRHLPSFLDACIITVGVGLLSWVVLIVPYFRTADMTWIERLTAIAYPLGDVALLAVAVRLVVGSGRRPPAFWLLAGSVVPLLVADALYGFMNLAGTWHEHHPVDIGWIAFYVGWGTAALHPSMRELLVGSTPASRANAHRLVLVCSAALIPPAVLFVQQALGPIHDAAAIALTGAVLFILVLTRTTGLARDVADTQNAQRFRALFDNASDAVIVIDTLGRVKYATPSTERVLGEDPGALLGRLLSELLSEADARALGIVLSTLGVTTTVEWKLLGPDGASRDIEVVIADLRGDARVDGLVFTIRDISERKILDAELRHQALHDTLTGLPNKSLFDDRVGQALGRADRDQSEVSVLFLDLDNFKLVNDSLGHPAGDELLVAVAARLVSVLESGDTVARFGGDEFVVLLEDVDADGAELVSDRLQESLREPFTYGAEEVPLHASIGIAVGRARHCTPSQLLRDADLAMYVAKRNGRARSERFAPEMHERAVRRLEVASELPAAILDGQLVLFYQPIVDVSSGRILGAEALVRWNHPHRGLIMPDEFIPIAEGTGAVVPLGVWVLGEACRQTSRWRKSGLVDDSYYISVNLAARHFKDRSVVNHIVHALTDSDLPARALLVEVTESGLMDDLDPGGVLRELRDLGVRLAIDDFGTGYSSLGRLGEFPVDIVKIDKSFIDRLLVHADGETMVRAVVALSHELGMKTVAEGVEDEEQAAALIRLGCTTAQGYFFARPMPSDAMTAELESTQSNPAERFKALATVAP
jgi:diguanylate cyclase (GGDEF)-like protein/PAS domain S-box-containing protein